MQHIGIINYKNKIIYVDLKDNDLLCYYYHNNKKRNISITTVLELFKSLFDKSKEEFIKQDGNYSIFVNKETGYKHFYKDGKEDILKFFLTNGTDGLLCKGTDINDKYLKVRKFVSKKTNIVIVLSLILATAISSSTKINSVNQDKEVQQEMEELDSASLETEYNEYYDFTSLSNAIKSPANVGNLSKDILYNEELIKDICNTPMSEDRIKSLEEKVTDIEIIPFTEEDDLDNLVKIQQGLGLTLGYYNKLEPNIIHVKDYADYSTIYHEFAHLLQANSEYSYIQEACAEIIAHEYFGCEIDKYKEEVKRMQVLMEIIGGEAIWNINFSGDDSKFDNIILENIPIEEYGELYGILIIPFNILTEQDREKLNAAFDKILSDLYSNIYHEPIEDNEVIQNIYKVGYDKNLRTNMKNQRHYFNDIDDSFDIADFVYSEYMTFQEAEDKGLIEVEMEVSSHVDITEEEYKERLKNNQDAYSGYEPLEGIKSKLNPETLEHAWIEEANGKEYTTEEALEQGLIRKRYYYIDDRLVDYRDIDLDAEMKAGNISGAQWRIIPLSDKYDNITKTDSQEIDGKKYYMVECSNNIYISNNKTKTEESSKSR